MVLPLWTASDARQLLDELRQRVPAFPDGFYASVHVADASLRAAVNARLMAVFQPRLASVCRSARLLGGAFINKAPGPRGVLPPHQDWNIVEEGPHRSFNVWAPLIDTDADNGAIQLIPGSHHWQATVRGPNIPCGYRLVQEQLRKAMRLLPIRAGEVLIYDHRVLHCSDANDTPHHRPAVVMGLVPEEADLKHYFGMAGRVHRYRSSVDFLLGGQTHLRPDSLMLEDQFDYDPAPVDPQQLAQFLAGSVLAETSNSA